MKNIYATDLKDILLLKTRFTSIDRNGIPPGLRHGEYPSFLYNATDLRDISLLKLGSQV